MSLGEEKKIDERSPGYETAFTAEWILIVSIPPHWCGDRHRCTELTPKRQHIKEGRYLLIMSRIIAFFFFFYKDKLFISQREHRDLNQYRPTKFNLLESVPQFTKTNFKSFGYYKGRQYLQQMLQLILKKI